MGWVSSVKMRNCPIKEYVRKTILDTIWSYRVDAPRSSKVRSLAWAFSYHPARSKGGWDCSVIRRRRIEAAYETKMQQQGKASLFLTLFSLPQFSTIDIIQMCCLESKGMPFVVPCHLWNKVRFSRRRSFDEVAIAELYLKLCVENRTQSIHLMHSDFDRAHTWTCSTKNRSKIDLGPIYRIFTSVMYIHCDHWTCIQCNECMYAK
jgi:hypothetical protein